MAVTSLTVISPIDNQGFGSTLRPLMTVVWVGGTGPFDVLYEWDTATTFDSGNLISDTNIGVTSPDEGVPPSDMGPYGTDWYMRATIYDLADTGTDEIQSVYNDASGGDFDLTFDGQTALAIPWNETAANLKTAIEGLSNITSVTVTGAGTSADPWIITFTDPGDRDVPMMTADDTSLTGQTVGTTIAEDTKGVYPTGTVAPGAGYHTLHFVDPADHPRFLYLNANAGVNFGVDGVGDGDPDLYPRFLYLNANVGVGFGNDADGPLGDGDPDLEPRFLYLNSNVTSDQPCPYVQNIAPTLSLQGGAVAIYGDSFGALASTYQSQVRLYDDQDLSGSYTVMSSTFWSDTELSVVVPAAATSGWVVVAHTNGLETCFSSTPKYLVVEQVAADPDAGWWLRTANRLNVVDAEHTVLPGNNVKTSFKKIMNAIGSGRIELPLGDPLIDQFVDPVARKGVLVQTYIDKRMRYGWYAEDLAHDYDEEGNAIAVISGRGMEVVALWNKLLPHDYPASPTKNPTWIYGSTDNLISNPGFEDAVDNPILSNPGGEDGNDANGNANGWSTRGDDVDSYGGVFDDQEARNGDWYIEVDASDNHSGITQSVTVEPNKEYHVTAYVKDPLASGMRITLALGGADDIAAKLNNYPNNFEWNNEILAELDNVPRNVNSNGLPGGATDGTWQVMDVEVLTGKEQTSLTLTIQNDHHQTGVFNPFWIDDVEIVGYGLGLDPWRGRYPDRQSSSSFQLHSSTVFEGVYACSVNPISAGAGIEQTVAVNPLAKYTLSAWMYADGVTGDWNLDIIEPDGSGVLDQDSHTPTVGQWEQYQVIYTMPDNVEEVIIRFTYQGAGDPGTHIMDSFSLVPGEPPSLAGVILNNVLDKMEEHGKLTYLTRTFTDTKDSAGQDWPSALSLDLEPSESLYGLLGRLVALGHEWEIVPADFREGGDTGFELNVYTARSFSPNSGVGFNQTGNPEGAVIMPGDATIGGRLLKSAFNANTIMAIGDDGVWSRVTQHPWLDADIQPHDPALHGYRDSFGSIEDVISVSAGDATTIAQFAEARLADEKDRERAIQLQMQRSAIIRPFIDFHVGDSLYVDMPPTDPDPPIDYGDGYTRSYPKRIRSIQAALAGEGADISFQVDIDRVIYEDELGWYAMIAQLSERSPSDNSGQGTGSVSGTGGAVSVVVGGTTSGDVTSHTHSLKSTDIKDKASSGDISGTLPGPMSVNALKGRPVSNTIPDPDGSLSVVMIFDPDTLTWTPQNADISVGQAYTDSVPFSQLGLLEVGDGTLRLYTPVGRTIVDVSASVGVASSSGVITVDVDMDGTTIFTTTTNRPEIAALANVSAVETPDVTAWAAGSYLTVNIDDAGTGATDLVVVVRYQEA